MINQTTKDEFPVSTRLQDLAADDLQLATRDTINMAYKKGEGGGTHYQLSLWHDSVCVCVFKRAPLICMCVHVLYIYTVCVSHYSCVQALGGCVGGSQ